MLKKILSHKRKDKVILIFGTLAHSLVEIDA